MKKYSKLRKGWNLPSGTQVYTEQPQIAQLELNYSGPLVKDSMVETVEDLTTLKNKYAYQHKRVWVKEDAAEYYLDNGDGSRLEDWKKSVARMVVQPWIENEPYQAGDVVMVNLKMYYALKDCAPGINPIENEEFWTTITGEIETYRYDFKDTASVIIYTEIRNPMFQIIKGDFVLDESGENEIDEETGFSKLINQEIIDAEIKVREDLENRNGDVLPDNEGGKPYEISFYSNEKPIRLTGIINVK